MIKFPNGDKFEGQSTNNKFNVQGKIIKNGIYGGYFIMKNIRMAYDIAMELKLLNVDINTKVNIIKVNILENAYIQLKMNIK